VTLALLAAGALLLLLAAPLPATLRRDLAGVSRPALVGGGAGAALGLALGDPATTVLLAACGGAVMVLGRRRRARLRASLLADAHLRDLPDALELLAAAVDGGAPLPRSLAAVAPHVPDPLGAALGRAAGAANAPTGPRLGTAIRDEHPALRPLAAIVAQSDELGTPLAPALRVLAADERARRRSASRERAAAAAPRMMLVVGLVLAPAALILIVGAQALALIDALGPGAAP